MSSKCSRRYRLAVIRGHYRVQMRYAIYGEPSAPTATSLVGMSQSHRKRKARELAFFRVKQSVLKSYSEQADVMAARERNETVENPWDKNRLTYPDARLVAYAEYRIRERLRPCPGCMACAGYLFMKLPARLHDRVKLDGVTEICGGSCVVPARRALPKMPEDGER